LYAIDIPASPSEKLAPVRPGAGSTVAALGLRSVKVIVLVAPAAIDVGLNDLTIVGVATTRSVLVAASGFVEPSTVLTVPSPIVFEKAPAVAAVTGTVTSQADVGARTASFTVTVPPPTGATTAPPPHEIAGVPAATVSPAGSVSTSPCAPEQGLAGAGCPPQSVRATSFVL
jgi:hypothetical protein